MIASLSQISLIKSVDLALCNYTKMRGEECHTFLLRSVARRDDNDVYVRSVHGGNGRWYQNITAKPDAAIHIEGRRLAVHAMPVTDEALIARVSNDYLRKYRDDPSANSMVLKEILPTTLRLEPT